MSASPEAIEVIAIALYESEVRCARERFGDQPCRSSWIGLEGVVRVFWRDRARDMVREYYAHG